MKIDKAKQDLDRLFSVARESEPELEADSFTETLSKEIQHRRADLAISRMLILSLGILAGILIFYLVFPFSQVAQIFFQALSYVSPTAFLTSLIAAAFVGISISVGALWVIDGVDDAVADPY